MQMNAESLYRFALYKFIIMQMECSVIFIKIRLKY